MKIIVSSDSTCDLNSQLLDRYNISVVPLNVILGDKSYLDGVDVTPRDIFDYVAKTGMLPKTSATSVFQYTEHFGRLLKGADAVIHISLSSEISSSYRNALLSAGQFGDRVYIIDSRSLCAGQGLIAIKASVFASQGLDPEKVVELTTAVREKVVTSFVPDSLDYLHKGGRCSLASMMGAKILKLHPLIVMKDGVMSPHKKYMGTLEACVKKYVADAAAAHSHDYDRSLCILASACAEKDLLDKVRAEIQTYFDFDEIVETTAGCTITSHCGKNTVALFFMTE